MTWATYVSVEQSEIGLISRKAFELAVEQALADGPEDQLTVILLNLDRFNRVNDTLGHAAGDAVLRLAAERLRSSVRKTDVVAHLGADEFGVALTPASTPEEAKSFAQRILDLLQRTYFVDGQLINIGVSLGIACSSRASSTRVELMRNADLALRHVKLNGRGSYAFFEGWMETKAQARRTSELELRRALALRQLEVFYQAQVNTDSNLLTGFEALIRWRHPEKGFISPAEFLPVAEEIGLIGPIGDWVLRTACKEATKWPKDITIAVNVSPLQFENGNFADSVRRALLSTGLAGHRLEIEITEGILLKNDQTVAKTLDQLRALDVRIAMDDFGVGYASLSQLAQFPFNKIKIDRSIAGVEGENPKQRAIVRAITALGQSLGMATLAEGVEDAAQVERLRTDGCHSVQGYFFSRPIPASEVQALITRLGEVA